jgi:hypothetical protein
MLLILTRGDVATRLVEQNIAQGGVQTEWLTIHDDAICRGIDRAPQCRNFFAVDDHPPLDDQGLSLTPGRHPGLRNDFLQPYSPGGYCIRFHVSTILHFPEA